MCVTIVPLAGPDFYTKRFGIRPLYPVGDATLLEYVLARRPWLSNNNSQLIFVLREEGPHTDEMLSFVSGKYPLANTVVLGCLSAGAPMSALAGIALSRQHDVPIIIDLADIAFDMTWSPTEYFRVSENVDAVVPYFISQDPKFSYLKLDGSRVIEAREKQVISSNASAGVYFFRDTATYLRALSYSLEHPEICRIGSAFFVCPSVNGLITDERQVHAIEVHNANPISTIFHESVSGEGI